MINFIGENWDIIKSNLRNVIIFIISMLFIALVSFSVVFNSHVNYIDSQMNNNIQEYGEVDLEQLCRLSNCVRVEAIDLKKTYIPTKEGRLRIKQNKINDDIRLYGNIHYDKEGLFEIHHEMSGAHFALNTVEIFSNYQDSMFILIPAATLFFILPLVLSIKEEKARNMISLAGNEALLANKSMIDITENIHHELNTPLEVIDNKIEKIHRILYDYIKEAKLSRPPIKIDKKIIRLEDDFAFIRTSSEQIYTVLDKMKSFKHLRYSNGNKSFFNIVEGGFKIINISNTNFEYNIDNKLKNYGLKGSILKNADILSIILNHMKNSLEAHASKIIFIFAGFQDNKIKIRIIDNGTGIDKKNTKDIFKANFSTKKGDIGVRGNGMYLNKQILETSGGTVNLISSSKQGTTIELIIPAIQK